MDLKRDTFQRHFSWFKSFAGHRKGSRVGAVVRALASHQCGLGSISAQYFIWVELVIVSRLAPRVFLLILRFFFLHENQRSKFQFDQDRGPAWKQAKADVDLFYVVGTTKMLHEIQLL